MFCDDEWMTEDEGLQAEVCVCVCRDKLAS